MSLSDCPKCWETPCGCGYEYRNTSTDRMIEFIWGIIENRDDINQIVGGLTGEILKSKRKK